MILVLLRLPTFFFERELPVLLVEFFLAGNQSRGPLLEIPLATREPLLQLDPLLLKLVMLLGQFDSHGFQLLATGLNLLGSELKMVG